MAYEIKTPILKMVADGTLTIFHSAVAGAADVAQGTLAVNTGNSIRRSVEADLKVRLAAPKLTEIEGPAAS